jgi:hypothetical protein
MSRVVVQPVPEPYHIATRSLRRSFLAGSDAEGSLVAHPARRSAGPRYIAVPLFCEDLNEIDPKWIYRSSRELRRRVWAARSRWGASYDYSHFLRTHGRTTYGGDI